MAMTPILAQPGAFLGVGTATILSVPANTTYMITQCTLTNTSNTPVVCTLYLSSSGSVISGSELIVLTVAGQSTQIVNAANHNLGGGGTLIGQADTASAVIVKVSAIAVV